MMINFVALIFLTDRLLSLNAKHTKCEKKIEIP